MTLEQKLTLALAHRRMSESEVAAAIGMSSPRFRRKMESGSFTLAELEKISQALGARFSLAYVFNDGTKI